MCELYAVNSRDTVNIKPNCDLFYQHSIDHPDGWGSVSYTHLMYTVLLHFMLCCP